MPATNANRRGLGKGLQAIFPSGKIFTGGRTIINIDINKIVPNPRQPRTIFNQENLQDLSDSIKAQGIAQPILVRMRKGRYELVAGERRLRAAKLAGLTTVPCIIKDFNDEESLELALIENLQRENLNPIDEAEGYHRLALEFKLTQEEIAKKVGKNRSTVANMLRILTLPAEIKKSLKADQITVGHARTLLGLEDKKSQLELWKHLLEKNLTVRDVETLVSGNKKPKAKASGRKRKFTQNTELNDVVDKLTSLLGTKVKIFGSSARGRIEVEYYSKEDLERIIELISSAA